MSAIAAHPTRPVASFITDDGVWLLRVWPATDGKPHPRHPVLEHHEWEVLRSGEVIAVGRQPGLARAVKGTLASILLNRLLHLDLEALLEDPAVVIAEPESLATLAGEPYHSEICRACHEAEALYLDAR